MAKIISRWVLVYYYILYARTHCIYFDCNRFLTKNNSMVHLSIEMANLFVLTVALRVDRALD